MKKTILFVLAMAMLAMTGCGSTSSSSSPDENAITQISYSISPEKETYTEGEEIVITAEATGPKSDDVSISWGFRLSGGSINGFPQSTDMTYTFNAPSSGATLVITGGPGYQETINGVVQFEGEISYTITVE